MGYRETLYSKLRYGGHYAALAASEALDEGGFRPMRWRLENTPFLTNSQFTFSPSDLIRFDETGALDYNTLLFISNSQLVVPAGPNVNFGNLRIDSADRGGEAGDVWQMPEEIQSLAGAVDNDLYLMVQLILTKQGATFQQGVYRFGYNQQAPLRWVRDNNYMWVYWTDVVAAPFVNKLGPNTSPDGDGVDQTTYDYEIVAPESGIDVYRVELQIDFTPWWS